MAIARYPVPRSSNNIGDNGPKEHAVVIRQPEDNNQVVTIKQYPQGFNQKIVSLDAEREPNRYTVQYSVHHML